jgi:hypothetical protein
MSNTCNTRRRPRVLPPTDLRRVSRFVDWLTGRREEVAGAAPVEPVVVEEVAAARSPDGYEINATFTADDRAISSSDLDTAVRRLGFARADLIQLAGRVREFEAGGGRLPVEHRPTWKGRAPSLSMVWGGCRTRIERRR